MGGPSSAGPVELVALELPAEAAYVGVARTVVSAVASTVDGMGTRIDDLRLAVSEACTNAVEAHAGGGDDARVVLRCRLDGRDLEVRVEDAAGGIDPDRLRPRSVDPAAADPPPERGWGIQLIRALVDEVEFASQGQGTVVRMVLRSAAP